MFKWLSLVSLLFVVPGFSQKVELGGRTKSSYGYSKESQDAFSMRSLRRVGIGTSAAGDVGLLGVNIDLNFSSIWSFSTGVGGTDDFTAYHIGVKRYFSGTHFLPYVGMGLARWTGQRSSEIKNTNPGFLADTLMSDSDKRNGRINELLIVSKLGMQYMTLAGPYAGYAFSFDVQLLIDPRDLELAPTGGLGMAYYF